MALPFSIAAGSIYSVTGAWNGATEAQLVLAASICGDGLYSIPTYPVSAQTVGIMYHPGSTAIYNGVSGDKLQTIPLGFILNELSIQYVLGFATGAPYNITLKQGLLEYIYSPVIVTTAGGLAVCNNAAGKRTRSSLELIAGFSYLSALYDPFGFSIASYQDSEVGPDYVGIFGTYVQWSAQLALTPSITPYTTTTPSTRIKLTDGAGKLGQIESLYVTYINTDKELVRTLIPTTNIEIISDFWWWFYVPFFEFINPLNPLYPELIIEGLGDGVEFSGYIPLGILTPNLVRGSGLYTLVPGQKHDTYYNRNTNPISTVNMKIPNPFGKTGFFNG